MLADKPSKDFQLQCCYRRLAVQPNESSQDSCRHVVFVLVWLVPLPERAGVESFGNDFQ